MEDFVTFEIAKKLKEKGFIQGFNISGCKFVFSDENTIKHISDIGAYENGYFGINVPCPTISQVLKWLREEKKIFIRIDVYENDKFDYFFSIAKQGDETWEFVCYHSEEKDYKSYEEAALAGIEYVLDNLI